MFTTRDVVNGCRGKVPYASRGEAKTVIRQVGSHPGGAKNLRPYRCVGCGEWHLTSMSAKVFRELRHKVAHTLSPFADASPVSVARSEYDH